jgi:hypothetical protein
MDGQESEDRLVTTIPIEPDEQYPVEQDVVPLFPATVGPCPLCRKIVTRVYGDRPEQRFWFHLAPRAGLCFRHHEGAKAWQ